jgi:hypothetical protein
MGIDTEQKGRIMAGQNHKAERGEDFNRGRSSRIRGRGFNRSLHELRSPPRMKTTGRDSTVRRTNRGRGGGGEGSLAVGLAIFREGNYVNEVFQNDWRGPEKVAATTVWNFLPPQGCGGRFLAPNRPLPSREATARQASRIFDFPSPPRVRCPLRNDRVAICGPRIFHFQIVPRGLF